MKMHLPLGLRRALFNTFIALGAVAAMSTAPAETTLTGYSDTATSGSDLHGEVTYLEGTTTGENNISRTHTDASGLVLSGMYSVTYETITNANGETQTLTHDGTITFNGNVTLKGNVTMNSQAYFNNDITTGFLYTLTTNKTTNYKWATWDGTGVTFKGSAGNFTLTDATDLTAYTGSYITLGSSFNGSLGIANGATVIGGENMNISADNNPLTIAGTLTATGTGTINLTQASLSGATIESNSGSITVGAVNGSKITSVSGDITTGAVATGTITTGGNITSTEVSGGTFTGATITLNESVTDTGMKLSVTGTTTLVLNGKTTLTNAGSSISVGTLDVNADASLIGALNASSTLIADDTTLTLNHMSHAVLGEVESDGDTASGNLTLTSSSAGADSVAVNKLTVDDSSDLTVTNTVTANGEASIAGTLHASNIVLNGNSTATGKVQADTALKVVGSLTISDGTEHKLGAVTGESLSIHSDAKATADSIELTTLSLGTAATGSEETGDYVAATAGELTVKNSVTAGTLTVEADGSLTSTEGNITASTTATLNGTVTAEGGTLSVAGGTATDATLTADEFTNTGNFAISGGTLDFDKTTVGTGSTLTINGTPTGDLGNVSVDGAGTVLDMNITGAELTGDISISNGGKLELDGAHKGDITASNGGTVTLNTAKVNGDVTLKGANDVLNMTSSAITGTLTAGNQSTVTLTGENTASKLVLNNSAVLNYNNENGAKATLTADVEVNSGSTANIGQTGLTGSILLTSGKTTIADDAKVSGNITLSNEDAPSADRTLTIEGDFTMSPDTQLNIQGTHSGGNTGKNIIDVETAGKTFTVEDLVGAGDVSVKGEGNITFAGDGSTHSGDIESTLTGNISATAEDSLGTSGALVLEATEGNTLIVTADQQKDITVSTATTIKTTGAAELPVTLSGTVSGGSLTLEDANLTLSGSGNDLQQTTVNVSSKLTTTAGTYHNVTNEGELEMQDSTLGNLTNNGTGTMENTAVLGGSNITNNGTLTLDNVTNADDANDHETIAGTLENKDNGELTIKGSDLTVSNAELAGTTTLAPSDDKSTATTLTSTEGTNVTGTVTGEGKLVSEKSITVSGLVSLEGHIEASAVTINDGRVELLGTMTTDSLTATGKDAYVGIEGDGNVTDGAGSALGSVMLDNATLGMAKDEFSGDITAKNSSQVIIAEAVYTGDISATDSYVTLNETESTGDITAVDSDITLSGTSHLGDISATGSTLTLANSTNIKGQLTADNSVVLEGTNNLIATEPSVIHGSISSTNGNASLYKWGENLTLQGDDEPATTADSYAVHVEEGSLTLDNTQRNGTIEAEVGTDIILTNGRSTVGELMVYGDGNASHDTPSENATHVVVTEAGTDYLASATGTPLSAADAGTGERGAQLIINGFAGGAENLADGQEIQVAENITGFDKEVVHGLDTQNVNLVEKGDDSYVAVSINHKGATKNKFQQGVSDAIVSAETVATGKLADMIHALAHTTSEGGSLAALNCIGGAGIATTMASQMSANRDHMRTLRHSIGQPEPLPYVSFLGTSIRRTAGTASPHEQQLQFPTRLWGMATGSSADLGSDSQGGAGYTRSDWGFMLGSDVTLSARSLVGIATGYSRAHVDALNHTTSGDEYFVDFYTRVNTRNTSHTATLGVGFFDWDLDRSVIVRTADLYDDFHGEGKGQAKGMALNFSYEAAYNICIKEKHTLSPVFQVESSLNHINGYRETGSLGNAGLNVEFDNTFVTTLGLGLKYAYEFDGFGSSEHAGSFGARAMLIGDVGDTNGTMRASFIGGGQSFEAESTKIDRQGILIGVDALVPVSKHWDIFGSADFEIRDDYRDISAGVGARYTF